MTVAIGRWHVYFDGKPELKTHICDLHRALGLSIPCDTCDADGNCAHVQIYSCSCLTYEPCDGCTEDGNQREEEATCR